MNMIPVSSSDIASIGYDGSTLHILFNSGGLYAYYNVPESVYNGLMKPVHMVNTFMQISGDATAIRKSVSR